MDAGNGYESDVGSDLGEEVAHQFSPIFGGEAPCFVDTADDTMPYQVHILLNLNKSYFLQPTINLQRRSIHRIRLLNTQFQRRTKYPMPLGRFCIFKSQHIIASGLVVECFDEKDGDG